uniref:CSON001805 protein n=1 Tax=Culicoides sonorensis TaxID=179676 RepID=A0A336M3L7_CULSO
MKLFEFLTLIVLIKGSLCIPLPQRQPNEIQRNAIDLADLYLFDRQSYYQALATHYDNKLTNLRERFPAPAPQPAPVAPLAVNRANTGNVAPANSPMAVQAGAPPMSMVNSVSVNFHSADRPNAVSVNPPNAVVVNVPSNPTNANRVVATRVNTRDVSSIDSPEDDDPVVLFSVEREPEPDFDHETAFNDETEFDHDSDSEIEFETVEDSHGEAESDFEIEDVRNRSNRDADEEDSSFT